MKDNIKSTLELVSKSVKPVIVSVDAKITTLIPNPKIKKVAYIGMGSLFGFMLLLIIIGILTSPFRNKNSQKQTETIKKPAITVSTPEPQKELTESQKEILKLEDEINKMNFPESELNIPLIERNLTI